MTVRTPPKAAPGVVVAASVVALLPIALAVVAIHDLAVDQAWSSGTSWSQPTVRALDGLTPSTGLVVVSVAVGLVGLLLVWLAVKPARRTHLRTEGESDLWISRTALAALAQNTADRSTGVIAADAAPRRGRRIVVDVTTHDDRREVEDRVRTALRDQYDGLTNARLTVHTRELPR